MFHNVQNLDIWYITTWVAAFQLVFNIPWAPLSAYMNNMDMHEIVPALYKGLNCFLFGTNFITPETSSCSVLNTCKNDCCDSCDGIYIYMCINNINSI